MIGGFGTPIEPAHPAEPAQPAPPAQAPAPVAPPADRGARRTLPPPHGRSFPPPPGAPHAPLPPVAATPPPAAPPPAAAAPPLAAAPPPPSGPVPVGHVPSGPTQPYPDGLPPAPSAPIPQPLSGPTGIPQPLSGPTTQPTSGPAPHPLSGPMAHAAGSPWAGAPPPEPAFVSAFSDPGAGDSIEEIPGSQFVNFLKISARRAFRLRIEPDEVLPSERRSLERASPPILDHNLQAFLAWRRSVLFLVACALVPLTVIGLIDAFRSRDWTAIFIVKFVPAFAEALFLWICWSQLKTWAHWRKQRRMLFWGWLLFMLAPFVVFIYPLETLITDVKAAFGNKAGRDAMVALGLNGIYQKAVQPFAFSMLAMLQLAPKAISLMPGLIRSSLVTKMLFPGVSAPGWLIVMSSPMYALLAYVILIIPYQFTGSGWFIAGVLGVVAAQAVLARAGFQLARPLSEQEALVHIKRVRTYYMVVMWISAVLIIVALGSLVNKLNLRATDVILAVLKFESNVLILTMIGADLVITNLDKARHYTAGRDDVETVTESKIAAFVSFEAPPPPPPGPAA